MTRDESIIAEADRLKRRKDYIEKIDGEFSLRVQLVSFDKGGERFRFDLDAAALGYIRSHLLARFDTENPVVEIQADAD